MHNFIAASDCPLITIITICFNNHAGLLRTHNSIRAQLMCDFEWVVIDGGSKDSTVSFLKATEEVENIHWLSEPDEGIYDAMNKGIDRAKGSFVVFMNAGDTFVDSHTLEYIANNLRDGHVDFLYGDSLEQFNGNALMYKAAKGHKNLFYGMFVCHQAVYYRRTLIGAMRYSNELKIAGDYDFTVRFLKQAHCIKYIPSALCIFDLEGTSNKNREVGRRENWRIQRDVIGLSWAKRIAIHSMYLFSAIVSQHVPILYKKYRYKHFNACEDLN
jgi:putative colanic acid biosynthesis glycosyltransferase